MKTVDLVVIGSGPGGYVACLRARQLGMNVVCVESRKTLGGTCLNIGCIPSKALLHSSHLFETLTQHGHEMGINTSDSSLNLKQMMTHKQKIVNKNTKGIEFLFKTHNIHHICGVGYFDQNSLTEDGWRIVSIKAADESITHIKARHVIIATGSTPRSSDLGAFDHRIICSSEDALSFSKVPQKLAIIGGGVIGLELGSVWRRLGAQVEVFEAADALIPSLDPSLSQYILKCLKKAGLTFHLSTTVSSIETTNKQAIITFSKPNKSPQQCTAHKVLMSIGRTPYTSGLGLENLEVMITNNQGQIQVDQNFVSQATGVLAIGDVIAGPMLAHKAEAEAVAAVEILAGQPSYLNANTIPNVVYTWPELASVGLNSHQLTAQDIPFKQSTFSLKGNARAQVWGEDSGFIKIYAEPQSGQILGAHLACPNASELIAEIVVAMNFGATAEDLYRSCHSHPSVSESIKEAALGIDNRTLHG